MAGYFDEHSAWQPLGDGEAPNHFLHFARMLVESGWGAELQFEFEQMFPRAGRPPVPPAAAAFLEALPEVAAPDGKAQCPVCLAALKDAPPVTRMPACAHAFHRACLLPWLQMTNSCPLCRDEVETDDEDYEAYRKSLLDKASRESNLEELHDTMYS